MFFAYLFLMALTIKSSVYLMGGTILCVVIGVIFFQNSKKSGLSIYIGKNVHHFNIDMGTIDDWGEMIKAIIRQQNKLYILAEGEEELEQIQMQGQQFAQGYDYYNW